MNEIKTHDTMSPEAQRIKIAEACGWVMRKNVSDWLAPDGMVYQNWGGFTSCPDYLNDLNACHEFEKTLTDPLRKKYQSVLIAEVIGWSAFDNERISIHATAAQRCEAFLRTLDLWKP